MEYKKVEEIGRGGFGVVSKVLVGGEEYALKEFNVSNHLPSRKVSKMKSRFEREAEVQSKIDHPNVLSILEIDLQNNPPRFLMPLADKDFWSEISRTRTGGDINQEPLFEVLAGLEELHRLGFVHRDLKPENILKVGERWVLSDLGLVMPRDRTTSALTSTDSAWGTEDYAAPELARNFKHAPSQADIYSFGCILHDLVNSKSRVPFSQHSSDGPLGPVIEKCTEKDSSKRFDDVSSLRSAISVSLTQKEVSNPDVNSWLEKITNRPGDVTKDEWTSIIHHLKDKKGDEKADTLLRAIDIRQIDCLATLDNSLLRRIAPIICEWVENNEFKFSYCDVLGSRLMKIYNLGRVQIKARTAKATLRLSCSHNRWSVMRNFNEMVDKSVGQNVADRIAIEIAHIGKEAVHKVDQINREIGSSIEQYHPRVRLSIEELRSEYFRDSEETGPDIDEETSRPSNLSDGIFGSGSESPFEDDGSNEETFEPDEDFPFDTSNDDEDSEADDDLPF